MYTVLTTLRWCCSPPPGAYRVADGAVADAGGHCCGPRHASGLAGLFGGSSLPGATAHPQLPGAHPSQRAGEAECQRCPSANVEATERGATSGHTAKIRGLKGWTEQSIICSLVQKRGYEGDEVMKPIREEWRRVNWWFPCSLHTSGLLPLKDLSGPL